MSGDVLRLLTTGSRGWDDANLLRDVMNQFELEAVMAGASKLIVVHGGAKPRRDPNTGRFPARSADHLVHLWATLLPHEIEVVPEVHAARWTAACDPGGYPPCPREPHRKTRPAGGRSYCPLAGHRRNEEMVAAGLDHAVAFWLDRSTGTADCLDRILKAGYSPDDVTVVEQRSAR